MHQSLCKRAGFLELLAALDSNWYPAHKDASYHEKRFMNYPTRSWLILLLIHIFGHTMHYIDYIYPIDEINQKYILYKVYTYLYVFFLFWPRATVRGRSNSFMSGMQRPNFLNFLFCHLSIKNLILKES